jgi:DNA polymerase III delta subunit
MNFNQWRNYAEKKDVSKVTYVCGEQNSLVELVIDDIKSILQVPATDYASVDASCSDNVWEIASQYPLDPNTNRLTIVRNADKLNSWNELSEWLAHSRNNPKNFLLFVSNLSDAPSVFSKGKRVGYFEHIELIRSKGKLVKCSTPNEEDLISWIQSYGLSRDSSQFLAARTSSNISQILMVLKKVRIWNGSPNKNALALLCDDLALDSFADYLILQDKQAAFKSLKTMDSQDVQRTIARLDSRLDMMLDLQRCLVRRMYDGDIAQATGIKIFLIKKFKHVAKDYTFAKVKQRRQLLAIIDAHLRNGAKVGILESLITLW